MNFKKILSGPFVWIFAAVLILIIGSSMVTGQQIRKVDTAYGLQLIEDGRANKVTVFGTDQRVDVELTVADARFGKNIQFYYVAPRGNTVAETIA
ncbi:MAG: cell division protein FtsH, partial [Actinobacteria bacterium]|nr:cell division protein FtsH [Actinomycetota bacterium]